MPRPRGSKNRPKDSTNGSAPKGATRPETTKHDEAKKKNGLTDEQLHGLTAHHAEQYERALKKKKETDAAFKNVCKTAKAEGVKVDWIKEYLEGETEEGQAAIKARLEASIRIARWRGFEAVEGTQFQLFEGDEGTPAFKAGHESGLRGDPAKCPPQFDINTWMAGWQKGQHVKLESIKLHKDRSDAEFEAAAPPMAPQQPEPDEF